MTLLVVGSVALDDVATPREARKDLLGGSASYFSSVASMIGPVRLVAVVGSDFPKEHIGYLEGRGVDLTGLQVEQGRTFHWSGRYLENMVDRQTLDTQLNVFETFKPTLPESYKDSEFLFLANIAPTLQLDVLDQVTAAKVVALDTMNFWLQEGEYLDALKSVLRRIDTLIVNDEEARLLSGEVNLIRAMSAIREYGVKRVIIKRGDAGAMLSCGDGDLFFVPAYPVTEVVDPTGAGDCFAGGLMAYLANTGDLSDAGFRKGVVFGSASGSFAVEAFSVDRFRSLTKEELLERCQNFARLVHFEPIEL